MFTGAFPIVTTPDLERALGFYAGLLDGQVEYQFPPEGDPVYVGLNVGSSHMGIAQDPEAEAGSGGQRFALWVYAEDCDAAVERLRAGGATVTEEPADQPWGERVARVLDPDGNDVIVGERSSPD
jgi:lactoylglutathione lyase